MSIAIRTATRLNVFPSLAGDNQRDVGTTGLVSGRKIATGCTFSVFVPDCKNVSFGENCVPVSFTTSVPVFYRGIPHVVSVCSDPKMRRIDAPRIIAGVANFLAIFNRAKGKLISHAMSIGAFPLASRVKVAVSLAIKKASPKPATIRASRLVNLRPEAVGKVNSFDVVAMKKAHSFSLDPTTTLACVRNDFCLLSTPALTVTVRNFLRGVFWGILTHVSSSFQLLAVQRDAYDIAAASCCHNYTTNRQTRQLACQ